MLNYQEIEEAVNSEVNAGGFADLMKAFLQLGVTKYDYFVAPGLYRYYDADSQIDLQMNGVPKPVAATGISAKIKAAVAKAQSGQIEFETFCQLAGEAGVTYWQTNLIEKTVTYYDETTTLLVEPIPGL